MSSWLVENVQVSKSVSQSCKRGYQSPNAFTNKIKWDRFASDALWGFLNRLLDFSDFSAGLNLDISTFSDLATWPAPFAVATTARMDPLERGH